MLKTIGSSDSALRLGANDDEVVGDSSKADNRNPSKKSKNIRSGIQTRIGTIGEPTFLTPNAKEAFN